MVDLIPEMVKLEKIALGGGCHWCTEAVFQSLKGVERVEQGYVAATGDESWFSEGVIVHYDAEKLPLHILLEVHLRTHKSTSAHSFRTKYRSAVYTFSAAQKSRAEESIHKLQSHFGEPLITRVLDFSAFKASREALHNYYQSDPNKLFCINYITPKLKVLLEEYSAYFNTSFLK